MWGFIAFAVLLVSYLIMPAVGIIGAGYAWLGAEALVSVYVLFAMRHFHLKGSATSHLYNAAQ